MGFKNFLIKEGDAFLIKEATCFYTIKGFGLNIGVDNLQNNNRACVHATRVARKRGFPPDYPYLFM
jgi:hypothetical protein